MIPVNTLISKLNDVITTGGLSELELAQVFGAIDSIENNGVSSVATVADLPSATDNKGRFLYIEDEYRYVFSNGVSWDISNVLKPIDVNLYAWGGSFNGDNTTEARSSPVSVAGNFVDWIQISAGRFHDVGIRANGTAWSWGSNGYGRLGDGTTTSRLSPVSVVGGFTDWIQVSAGFDHSLGIRANGTAWSWGLSNYGRLGDNSLVNKSSPVSVIGGFTDWTQITAGGRHSLGLRAGGTIWAWGYNGSGRLGDNTTTSRLSPVLVVGGFTDWIQVATGSEHCIGLRANGTAWAWGQNGNGRLGDGTNTNKSSPVSVVGGFTDWIQASAGGGHSVAIRANGTAWAWGSNTNGQLGDGTNTNKSSPVSVVGGFTDWIQSGSRDDLSLVIRSV